VSYGKVTVLALAAGRGTRFLESGYTVHKTLIPVRGEKMSLVSVKNSIDNLGDVPHGLVFVTSTEVLSEDPGFMNQIASTFNDVEIVVQSGYVNGPAISARIAAEKIDPDLPLLLVNVDQYIKGSYELAVKEVMSSKELDGALLCFYSDEDRYSYVTRNNKELATSMQEKVVLSDTASTGICFWKTAKDFYDTLETINKEGEFFISDVYSRAIADGKRFKVFMVDAFIDMGTPRDLDNLEEKWLKTLE
jgi:dTDP-glucose pyrophosphorylase